MNTKHIVIVRVIFLATIITIFFTALAFCQEEITLPAVSPGKTVTAIELKGNKSISTTTIVSKIKTRIGQPYLVNIASDDLKRLYLLGYFSDVRIDTEDYKGGIKVIIEVVEKPIIEKLIFSGVRRLSISRVKEDLKSKEGQYLDYPKINEDLVTIKELYAKRGFADVDVVHSIDINKETNKASLSFVIQEGRRLKIRIIDIEGNKSFSEQGY
jgi:outer membrane protein insertion porin family